MEGIFRRQSMMTTEYKDKLNPFQNVRSDNSTRLFSDYKAPLNKPQYSSNMLDKSKQIETINNRRQIESYVKTKFDSSSDIFNRKKLLTVTIF
jgi:hypothetical protein